MIGHSLGGHNGIYTAVFDDRISASSAAVGSMPTRTTTTAMRVDGTSTKVGARSVTCQRCRISEVASMTFRSNFTELLGAWLRELSL